MAVDYYLVFDYDPQTGDISKGILAMTTEDEIREEWSCGDVIPINGEQHVLGPRILDKKNKIVTYEILPRDIPGIDLGLD